MYTFTIRHSPHAVLAFFVELDQMEYEILSSIIGIPIGFLSNTILATLFAEKVTELTAEGLNLSWEFLVITGITLELWLSKFFQKWFQRKAGKNLYI